MNTHKSSTIHFSTVLASSIHDIKNSLTTVRELIMQIADKQQSSKTHDFIQLEFEANRINNSLIQLLELYKIDSESFSLSIDEYPVIDILQEVRAQQQPLIQLNQLTLTVDCPNDLYCYCDYHHVCNCLVSILNNAQRYTATAIKLSAYQQNNYIVFCIEDDGKGYPEQILKVDFNNKGITQLIAGNTGLGLHFAATIAALHTTKHNQGCIDIDNESCLGGSRFRLFLP